MRTVTRAVTSGYPTRAWTRISWQKSGLRAKPAVDCGSSSYRLSSRTIAWGGRGPVVPGTRSPSFWGFGVGIPDSGFQIPEP